MAGTKKLVLKAISGKDTNKIAVIKEGTCKVLGRDIDLENVEGDQTVLQPQKQLDIDIRQEEIERINLFLDKQSDQKKTDHDEQKQSTASLKNPYRRTSDFILNDEKVSRIHAMIFYGDDSIGVIDLASTNGTFVNNQRVDMLELAGVEIVRVGNTDLQLSLNEE